MNTLELSNIMETLNFVKFHYSINNIEGDRFFVICIDGKWQVGYCDERGNIDIYYKGEFENYACEFLLEVLVRNANKYISEGRPQYAFINGIVPKEFDKYRKKVTPKSEEAEITVEELIQLKKDRERISNTLTDKIKSLFKK